MVRSLIGCVPPDGYGPDMDLSGLLIYSSATTHDANINWGDVPGWVTASAAVIALVFAGLAARAAFAQAAEARTLREEQAAPYVVVDAEISPASSMYMDLVVKNIGKTVARDVQISFDPPLQSTMDDRDFPRARAGFLARAIPAIPPGREYRMLLESGPELHKSDLPRVYRADVDFDGVGGPHSLTYEIDLNLFYDFESLSVYGIHDVAKHLKDILGQAKKWQAPGRGHGLLVHTLDERDERRRDREHLEARRAEQEQRRREAAEVRDADTAGDAEG